MPPIVLEFVYMRLKIGGFVRNYILSFLFSTLIFPNSLSLSFDGTDDYVEVPYSSTFNNFTDALSFSAWVNIQGGAGNYRTIMENGNTEGFALMVGTGGDIYANVQNGSGWTSVYS